MADNRPGILIVDDEELSLQTLTRTLDEEFEVFTAGSAAEVFAWLQQKKWRHPEKPLGAPPGACWTDASHRSSDYHGSLIKANRAAGRSD